MVLAPIMRGIRDFYDDRIPIARQPLEIVLKTSLAITPSYRIGVCANDRTEARLDLVQDGFSILDDVVQPCDGFDLMVEIRDTAGDVFDVQRRASS